MSIDGGYTFKEIKKGSSLVEYGENGGVICMVDNMKPTNIVYYSLNEGEN